jgi:hypothetical protein
MEAGTRATSAMHANSSARAGLSRRSHARATAAAGAAASASDTQRCGRSGIGEPLAGSDAAREVITASYHRDRDPSGRESGHRRIMASWTTVVRAAVDPYERGSPPPREGAFKRRCDAPGYDDPLAAVLKGGSISDQGGGIASGRRWPRAREKLKRVGPPLSELVGMD